MSIGMNMDNLTDTNIGMNTVMDPAMNTEKPICMNMETNIMIMSTMNTRESQRENGAKRIPTRQPHRFQQLQPRTPMMLRRGWMRMDQIQHLILLDGRDGKGKGEDTQRTELLLMTLSSMKSMRSGPMTHSKEKGRRRGTPRTKQQPPMISQTKSMKNGP
jgi:hypothetical protein